MANSWMDDAEELLHELAEPKYNAVRLFIKVEPDRVDALVHGEADVDDPSHVGEGAEQHAELGYDTRRG